MLSAPDYEGDEGNNPSQKMRNLAEMSDTHNRKPTLRHDLLVFPKPGKNSNKKICYYKVTLNLVSLLQTLAKCLLPLRP